MYSREMVERLLPTVWDWEGYCAQGLASPYEADKDMPKSPSVDPRRSTDVWAYLIDIREAWRSTELTELERRAVFMRFGLDDKVDSIGRTESVTHQTISQRIDTAVGKITARLNAEEYIDGYDALTELVEA